MCSFDDADAPRAGDTIDCGPSGFEIVLSVVERREFGDDMEWIVETERGSKLRVAPSKFYSWACVGIEP